MKTIITLTLLVLSITASAQKVTRKDLRDLLLKQDSSGIIKDGFEFLANEGGRTFYQRFDRNQVISFNKDTVSFSAENRFIKQGKRVETTPETDLFWTLKDSGWDLEEVVFEGAPTVLFTYREKGVLFEKIEYVDNDMDIMQVVLTRN